MLVKLRSPSSAPVVKLNFDTSVPPVDTPVQAVGLGSIDRNGKYYPDDLLKVTVDVWNQAECSNSYRQLYGMPIPSTAMCAGDDRGQKDSCFGDSGGPLLDDSGTIQYGITSFGAEQCADADYPGVYTRVSSFAGWIQTTVCSLSENGPEEWCGPDNKEGGSLCPSRSLSLFDNLSKGGQSDC